MKKLLKFEKLFNGTRAKQPKQPKVKNALLQTYFTSLLSLVLCVTMFFGTSYAWFTSEVDNTGNEIYIGTLKVGLDKYGGIDGENREIWDDLASSESNGVKLFDRNIRWEPGYTSLETIRVTNLGDLAFKYNLYFTDGVLADNSALQAMTLANVAQYFDVWLYDYRVNAGNTNAVPEPNSYADIGEATGWTHVGTLADVLNGKAVLEGKIMQTVRDTDPDTAANAGTTDGVMTVDKFTIALHMSESATSEVMGHKITLNVKLVAYQMVSETDSMSGRYDQMVATQAQLKEALANGGVVALATDIKLTEGMEIDSGKTVTLDLNGHKIFGTASETMTSLITNNGTLMVMGSGEIAMTYDGANADGKSVNAISNRGTITVNGGKISNVGIGNQIGYGIDNYNGAKLTVNSGEITASGSGYYDGIRLFCGSSDTIVEVNGGTISSIWAQNPTADRATEVKGTVILNGGTVTKTYFENYTIVKVKVKEGFEPAVAGYGTVQGRTTEKSDTPEEGYHVYRWVPSLPNTDNT